MATTGEIYAGSAETVAESPWLDETWGATITNATGAPDGVMNSITAATFDTGDQSYVAKHYNYDFSSIPAGSTIDGVIVRIKAAREMAGAGTIGLVQLLNVSRAKVGNNPAVTDSDFPLTATGTEFAFGSSTDLWGNALTLAWVQDPDFGVALGMWARGNNTDVEYDAVSIEIFYTEPQGVYGQVAFRGRNDDGSESGATWKAAQNTNWTQPTAERFRARFEIQESGGIVQSQDYRLQYNVNGGSYANVGQSGTAVKVVASPNITDGVATTNQLTAGTGTFTAGEVDEAAASIAGLTIAASGHTELEYVLEIDPALVSAGDTIGLRVYKGTVSVPVALNSYAQTPSITVSKPVRTTGTARISLGTLAAAGAGDQKITVRARAAIGGGAIRIQVYEGGTQRYNADHNLTASFQIFSPVVTGVTNPSNLELRLQGIGTAGYQFTPQVSWARYSTPQAAGPPQITVPATLTLTPVVALKKIAPRTIAATVTLTPALNRKRFFTQPVGATLTAVVQAVKMKFLTVPATLSITSGLTMRFKHFETLAAALNLTAALTKFQIRPRTVAANLTLTPAFVKTKLQPQAYTLTLTPILNRKLFRLIAAGLTATPELVKVRTSSRTIPATLTLTPAMILLKSKTLSATLTITPVISFVTKHFRALAADLTLGVVLNRRQNRTLAVTLNTNPVVAFVKSKFFTVPAGLTLTPAITMRKTAVRSLAADLTLNPIMLRRLGKTVAVTVTMTPVIVLKKTLYRTIAASLNLTPQMQMGRLTLRTISANMTAAAQIQLIRITHIQITPGLTLTPVISRRLAKQLNAVINSVGDLTAMKGGGLSLSATLTMTVNLVRLKTASRALSASLTLDTTLTRLKVAPRLLAAVVSAQPTLIRARVRSLPVGLTLTPLISFSKTKFVTVAANLVITPVITRLKLAARTLSANLAMNPVISRMPKKNLDASLTLTPNIQRKHFKLLNVILEAVPLIQRGGDKISMEVIMVLQPKIDKGKQMTLAAELQMNVRIGFQRIIMRFRDWLMSARLDEPVLESAEIDEPELVSAVAVTED